MQWMCQAHQSVVETRSASFHISGLDNVCNLFPCNAKGKGDWLWFGCRMGRCRGWWDNIRSSQPGRYCSRQVYTHCLGAMVWSSQARSPRDVSPTSPQPQDVWNPCPRARCHSQGWMDIIGQQVAEEQENRPAHWCCQVVQMPNSRSGAWQCDPLQEESQNQREVEVAGT